MKKLEPRTLRVAAIQMASRNNEIEKNLNRAGKKSYTRNKHRKALALSISQQTN